MALSDLVIRQAKTTGKAYNHAEYVEPRRRMMQDWADRLDLFEQNMVEAARMPLTIRLEGVPVVSDDEAAAAPPATAEKAAATPVPMLIVTQGWLCRSYDEGCSSAEPSTMHTQIDMVRKFPYYPGITIRNAVMPEIHEVATLTSKGQITLPKSIRQALGVDTGGKVAFDLRDGEVVVTRADAEHEDPAIAAFLTLLARDIEAGRNVRGLPEDLARTMLEHAGHKVVLGDDFDEDVEI